MINEGFPIKNNGGQKVWKDIPNVLKEKITVSQEFYNQVNSQYWR